MLTSVTSSKEKSGLFIRRKVFALCATRTCCLVKSRIVLNAGARKKSETINTEQSLRAKLKLLNIKGHIRRGKGLNVQHKEYVPIALSVKPYLKEKCALYVRTNGESGKLITKKSEGKRMEDKKIDKTDIGLKERLTKATPLIFAIATMAMICCLAIVIICYNHERQNDIKELSNDINQLRQSVTDYQGQTANDIEEVKTGIKTLNDNDKAHTDQIDGLNNSLDLIKKDLKNQVDKLNEKIKALEEAKAEKKALEAEMLATSYTPAPTQTYTAPSSDGCLTPSGGVYYYGNQRETYYNLPMDGVIQQARNFGIEGEYWVRDDGVKMYGDYVIVAANRDVHPIGSLVETSLGTGISLDTGAFAAGNPTQVDIATSW